MATLEPKNAPSSRKEPYNRYSPECYVFDMDNTDVQIAYLPVQISNFRPPTLVFSAYGNFTVEVTTSPYDEIEAGTAVWATVTATSNLLVLNAHLTAIRLTCSLNGSKARMVV